MYTRIYMYIYIYMSKREADSPLAARDTIFNHRLGRLAGLCHTRAECGRGSGPWMMPQGWGE